MTVRGTGAEEAEGGRGRAGPLQVDTTRCSEGGGLGEVWELGEADGGVGWRTA